MANVQLREEFSKRLRKALQGAQQSTPGYRVLPDQELVKRYRKLNPRQQHAVAEIITALASKHRRR